MLKIEKLSFFDFSNEKMKWNEGREKREQVNAIFEIEKVSFFGL